MRDGLTDGALKALVLCWDFPPHSSAGAARPWSWFLHWKKYGVDPVVVTRHWDEDLRGPYGAVAPSSRQETGVETTSEGAIVRVPFRPGLRDRMLLRHGEERRRLPRRALSFAQQAMQFCTFVGDARRPVFDEASRLLARGKFDVIVATGEPFVLFRYAAILSRRHGVPWIADYRDLWRLNHVRGGGGAAERMLLAWEGFHERRLLRSATFAVTVSDELAAALSAYLGKTVHVIPNGAELTLFDGAGARFERFSLVYTGILYDLPYVAIFADGFRNFMTSRPDAEIDVYFVGATQRRNRAVDEVLRLAAEFPRVVKIVDRVPLREAARYQARGSVLLSFIAGTQAKGLFGAKTYSYAATRNPILVVPNEGGRETSFFPGRDVQRFALDADEVRAALEDFYDRFRRGEPLGTSLTDEEVFSLSSERQAARLAELLKERAGA